MLEARVLHLINGDIDGELGPQESAELSSILESSAEARAMHAELRKLVERMEAMPEREPPAGLAGRILAQIRLPARRSGRASGSYLSALLASWRPAQAGFAFAAGLLLTVGFYEATQRNGEPLDLSRMVGAMVADPAGASAQQQGTLSLSAPGLSGTVRRGAIGEFTVLSFDLESVEQTEIVVGFAEDTPAELIGTDGAGWTTLETVLDLGAVALAAEQVGGAQKVLEMAVDYAKVRVQFGRPIGSFQAIKHKCADMLLEVESAKSAAYYGMWCASEMNDELPSTASLAKAYCSEAYFHAAAENIQIHGGIGFTWEHPAHLYFKRAKSSELLFGDPTYHREQLAQRIGI